MNELLSKMVLFFPKQHDLFLRRVSLTLECVLLCGTCTRAYDNATHRENRRTLSVRFSDVPAKIGKELTQRGGKAKQPPPSPLNRRQALFTDPY